MALKLLQNSIIKKRIFKCVLDNGKLSIPHLSKELDYSVPTMTKYVSELCSNGFLCEYGKITTKEGRYPNSYGVNVESFYFVGVDIRWFSLAIGIIDISGEVIISDKLDDFKFSDTEDCLNFVVNYINKFITNITSNKKSTITHKKIISINVNLAGRVNTETGYSYSHFRFCEKPLADTFTERLGIYTTIDNDTRSMTYGEYICHYKVSQKDIMFINVGWGLGMGVVVDSKLYYGKSGYTGEFGHINVFDNDIMCHCGKKGCAETEISCNALHREILTRLNKGDTSILSGKFNNKEEITIYDIISAINNHEDMLCIEELEILASKLGRQIANLINLFNPQTVIIGGMLSNTEDYILLPVKTAVRKYSLNLISRDTSIVLSKLQNNAGITGACLLARDKNLI